MNIKNKLVILVTLLFPFFLFSCSTGQLSITEESQVTQSVDQTETFNGKAISAYPENFLPCACPFILPEDVREGEDVECAYLFLPENRETDTSRQIRLILALFHRPGGVQFSDPVVYLSGGPGMAALETIHLHFEEFSNGVFAAGRDLIVFDQRGMGLSKPGLDCPEYDRLALDLLDGRLGEEEIQKEKIPDLILSSLETCRQAQAETADLSAYNSVSNADDVENMRQALGYDQINLWGISYGSRLALEVIRRHPDHLRSVILEGVFPPDVDLFSSVPANYWRSLELLFVSCEENEICSRDYPELRNIFFETVDRLNNEPIETEVKHPLSGEVYEASMDGGVLLGLVFQILYDSYLRYLLPQIIYDASQNNFVLLDKVRASLLLTMQYNSRGMYLSVMCNEEASFSSQDLMQNELQKFPELESLYSNNLQGKLLFDICEIWDAGQAAPEANQAVYSDLPVLIFNGEFDPVTPPVWGEKAAETLPNSYVFEFPGIGHGASFVEACPQRIFKAFLVQPERRPDGSCIENMNN